MKRLVHHPNIIHLFEGFTGPTKELYFVMEFMNGGNLYQYLEEKRDKGEKLNEMELRPVLRQILNALESIHEQGYFHRDLKPENLLVNTDHGDNGSTQLTIKLADFGLARELKSKAPYTDYVSTRWYRSPEVLLKSTTYSSSVDIWAVGVIMAELLTLHPLFPGQSEIDQLFRICEVIGSPAPDITASTLLPSSSPPKKKKIRNTGFSRKKSESALSTHDPVTSANSSHNNTTTSLQGDGGEWKEGVRLAQKLGFQFPQVK
ncbi:kinase-like domain-containing protein [Absidia repens]|uniref:Kinase-like domain-containing protein n=1 Tax=Absidia repens TaxID=90262 RepID=A0A1X2IHR1_9FUNG|nr:kinase-like domain-containing protein [Absidia repens]